MGSGEEREEYADRYYKRGYRGRQSRYRERERYGQSEKYYRYCDYGRREGYEEGELGEPGERVGGEREEKAKRLKQSGGRGVIKGVVEYLKRKREVEGMEVKVGGEGVEVIRDVGEVVVDDLLCEYFGTQNKEGIKEAMERELLNSHNRNRLNCAETPPCSAGGQLYKGLINNNTITNPKEMHLQWTAIHLYKGERETFRKAFIINRKDFAKSREEFLTWRSVGEIVLMYYRYKHTLKLPKLGGRDSGRIADTEIKEIVDGEWSREEMDVFERMYPEVGKKWAMYLKEIKRKSEGDIKIYYRYYKKHVLESKRKPRGRPKVFKREGEERVVKTAEDVIKAWTCNERVMFAILFPHIGKNWESLSQYVVTKTAAEIRSYHRVYYKNLTSGERILESQLKDLADYKERSAPTTPLARKRQEDGYMEEVGLLFRSVKKG